MFVILSAFGAVYEAPRNRAPQIFVIWVAFAAACAERRSRERSGVNAGVGFAVAFPKYKRGTRGQPTSH